MDQNAKSQAVERIKEAQNVLITVSANPSVDQLAAAIGFTLLLNKLDKHATAVFSGAIPSTIEFLKPEETLEQTTDSLRDFIISLDKSKADKLRYKVEDEVVRIFITPYKTKLSEDDLIFSQGDFNVDVVVALGVDNREHIDQAIMAHGRILHDATVIGVMAGTDPLDVGSINWQDPNASSLCEMLMSISESLKSGIVDNQIATAFLTGIVATTDRFKNDRTTPKVMTMSAQLMAAGANQQLIAAELTPPEPQPIPVAEDQLQSPEQEDVPPVDDEGTISLHHGVDEQHQPVEDQHVHIDDTGNFSNAEQLREAVEQVQENKAQSPNQDSLQSGDHADTPDDELLPGEEINPDDSSIAEAQSSDESEPSLPQPEMPEALPQITHERWGKEATYLDHPPSSEQEGDLGIPSDAEAQSIEQAANQNYSKYISGKPTNGSPLNATEATVQEESIDPLSSIPQAGPVATLENGSTESPLLSTQHDAESPLATEVPTTSSPQLSDDGETDVNSNIPLGPSVEDSNTLSEIETNVENFENEFAGAGGSDVSEDDARKAVMDAINQAGPSQYEAPNQNIGAQFVPLDTEPKTVDPTVFDQATENGPPSVPPPLVPPFPLPGVEVYDPSIDEANKTA